MQLFYNPNVSESDSILNFDKDESRHIVRVLRKKSGDIVHITNGKGWLFTSELISVEQKYCSAKIISKQEFKKRIINYIWQLLPPKLMTVLSGF